MKYGIYSIKTPSGSTSAPPWDEIKHLFEGQSAPGPRRRTRKKKR